MWIVRGSLLAKGLESIKHSHVEVALVEDDVHRKGERQEERKQAIG